MVFKSFSFDLGNSRKNTNYIIFRSEITEISVEINRNFVFFEFEVPFRLELANFGEISVEISFPANGGIRKKNEKVNLAHHPAAAERARRRRPSAIGSEGHALPACRPSSWPPDRSRSVLIRPLSEGDQRGAGPFRAVRGRNTWPWPAPIGIAQPARGRSGQGQPARRKLLTGSHTAL